MNSLLLAIAALSQSWAAAVPAVGDGRAVYEDSYVKDYRETLASVKKEMAAIRAAMGAIPEPTDSMGALASQGQLASMYAPMAGLMAKAEAAHMKMIKHLLGAEASSDAEFHVMLGLPQFDEKGDSPSVQPQEDPASSGEPDKPALIALRPEFLGPGAGVTVAPGEPLRDAVQSAPVPSQDRTDDVMDGIRSRMKERQQAVERLLAGRK